VRTQQQADTPWTPATVRPAYAPCVCYHAAGVVLKRCDTGRAHSYTVPLLALASPPAAAVTRVLLLHAGLQALRLSTTTTLLPFRLAMDGNKAPMVASTVAEKAAGPSHWDDVEANRKDVNSCLARQDGTATLSWSNLVVKVKDIKVGCTFYYVTSWEG
jgi:hypothetical protein